MNNIKLEFTICGNCWKQFKSNGNAYCKTCVEGFSWINKN